MGAVLLDVVTSKERLQLETLGAEGVDDALVGKMNGLHGHIIGHNNFLVIKLFFYMNHAKQSVRMCTKSLFS